MKNRTYFILAVATAIVLPVLFSLVYFKDIYSENNNENVVAKIDNSPEIIFIDGEVISELDGVFIKDEDYEDANTYHFEVGYDGGNDLIEEYDIIMKDIKFSSDIDYKDFKWKLFLYDEQNETYQCVASGNLDGKSENRMLLAKDLKIGLGGMQKFKLYYYFSSDSVNNKNYAGITFNARIDIE